MTAPQLGEQYRHLPAGDDFAPPFAYPTHAHREHARTLPSLLFPPICPTAGPYLIGGEACYRIVGENGASVYMPADSIGEKVIR